MMLVDTSVWIDYFNGIENPHTDLLDSSIVEGSVAIGDLIFLEILQGIRTDREYRQTKQSLLTLDQHELFSRKMAGKCADNYRALRKKGITIRKNADIIIATFCIENDFPLLFLDRDFKPFVEHLGLAPALRLNP
ncbi:membrane-associated protein containing RNA-binding TRAM domain and ribonuclease PIN-domain [Halorhodospira halochloris]|uniref:Membrane-associated protein containing RNA-binding TRAM domain and ribonuclease PIN-domain n=1 Tax=Halorhodospira halochloris TaxID=1052 RepID=A0A0X8XCH1_HALHR|nr:PIN domain nuclease [Halorhodospira halochloris]MBK1652822.1 VapC toxin family PIN domain ribonuclease [Halorhodospira halochloris]MCG5549354.1 PIN domain nuclease [Halorhodospira halochloris]BAU58074.1 membrane-associated protein containing RNA-binding TRAM domain and ribonuclease PIN-domain [Halorhodospira halochloris]